ncbi:MAG: hypothetical protein JKP98_04120 [Rhodobacteraceae bacterium]|nr:hypothetical protein [Paracoccaceae bacterium]
MALLTRLSTCPTIQHEPFNRNRKLGHVTALVLPEEGVARPVVATELDAALRDALARPKNIKHCIDHLPSALHMALLRVASELGYRHAVLFRRDEAPARGRWPGLCNGAWGRRPPRNSTRNCATAR